MLKTLLLNILSIGTIVTDVAHDFISNPISWLIGGSIAFMNLGKGIDFIMSALNRYRNGKND